MNSSQDHMQLQLRNFIQNQHLNPFAQKIALQTSKGIFCTNWRHWFAWEATGNYTTIYLKRR